MNNDLRNNHSSVSSNKYIANKRYPPLRRFYQESIIKDKNQGMLDTRSKGNRTIFFDSDNDKRPSNQKDLLISKAVSKYPTNYAAGPHPYNDGVIQGYYVNAQGDPRYNNRQYQIPLREINQNEDEEEEQENNYYRQNIENGGEEIEDEEGNEIEEEEIENGNEYENASPQKNNLPYNAYIGDGIVRNNIPDYSPNPNGQNIRYYKKKKFLNFNNNYNDNYIPENENENQDDQYIMESPQKSFNLKDYSQPIYNKKRILGNLGDSASSEAYANTNNQKSPNIDSISRIYVKPKTKYHTNNIKNGISPEERGIESKIESTNNVANNGNYLRRPNQYMDTEENELYKYDKFNKINNYDQDSINVVEPPIYTYPINERNKGGKVDLNTLGIIKNRGKDDDNPEEKGLENEYEIAEEKIVYIIKLQKYYKAYHQVKETKATKIQSFWRGRSTRRIMSLYNDLDEFIYILSKVHFMHFSDNFYYFINQLFNVYKANTLDNNEIESLEEDKENEEEEEKIEENNTNNKNYDELLNDYNNLQKKYDDLVKNKFNKSSTKKSLLNNNNNDIISVPGETTIGTIRTEKPKLKFKGGQNNSVNNFNNENLTFSNDNDEMEGNKSNYGRRFLTPNLDDEESFNEKDKRFSYSSIHSEENSKFFDNEHPSKAGTSIKRNLGLKNRGLRNPKTAILSLNKQKDKIFSYSPSIDIDKQSRGNSTKKNNEDQNENRINNISVIIPKHEEEFGIINEDEPKKIIEKAFDKYLNNYSKNLRIVKNNKINYENPNEKLNCFDNEVMFPENENTLELVAPKKSIDQKVKDVFDNEKLIGKIKDKISKEILPPKIELTKDYGESFIIENTKPSEILDNLKNQIESQINNLEIIQNDHRNFSESKLDYESNELFLGEPSILKKKKKLKKLVPISENEINIIENYTKENPVDTGVFSKEKTLPSFNINNLNIGATIKDIIPKTEEKPKAFNAENMLIDNVFNSEFNLDESRPKTDREDLNKKEKEIVYLPFKDNKFKRLRRSKRTKDTYFTIKSDINSKKENKGLKEDDKSNNKNDMIKICENKNFEIKSEYYYVETIGNQMPEVIEKKIKETIVINTPSKESNRFNDDKTKLSNENNFDIKSARNKNIYLEDIEKNELIILSERVNKKRKKDKYVDEPYLQKKEPTRLRNVHKKNNEIISNEGFIIHGEDKKWGDKELNPEANEEFSFRNDLDVDNIIDSENEIDDDKKYKNEENGEEELGEKEDIENKQNAQNVSFNIEETEQFEIIDKTGDKKDKLLFVESKENEINLEGTDSNVEEKGSQIDIKQVQITTKKILKHERVLSRKKFLNNENSLEESFSIYGTLDKNNKDNLEQNKNEIIKKELLIEKNCEFGFKKQKKETKENETEIEERKEFNNILSITNEEFAIKRKKIKKKETETETGDEFINNKVDNQIEKILENINNENILIKGKKKKMKEAETEIDNELINLEPYFNNEISLFKENNPKGENNIITKTENIDLIAPEKEIKEKILEYSKIDDINLESRNRSFPKLDMNNCIYQTFDGKEKEKIILENIKNESLMFEAIEQEKDLDQPQQTKDKEYYIESNQITFLSKEKEPKDEEEPKEKEEIKLFKELNMNKSEEYTVLGKEKPKKKKKKKKMKEIEVQAINDLNNNIDLNNNELEPLDEENKEKKSNLRGKKQEKGKEVKAPNLIEKADQFFIEKLSRNKFEKENRDEVKYESIEGNNDNNNNKIFSNLNINKCEEQEFSGKEKKKEMLESIKNDSIIFNGKEKENLENIKNESLLLSGKEKEKQILEQIKNDPINLDGKEKEKQILEKIKNDPINLYEKEREKQILEQIKNDPINFNGKEKEKQILESIQNEPISFSGKQKMKEDETQIDNDILNSNLIKNNNENFSYESVKPQKSENIITNDNNIFIEKSKKSNKLDLVIEEQKPLNINNNKKYNKFNQDLLSICFSENIEIKPKEENEIEEQKPENNLSKKFNKLLISDNENEIPELNSNMINNLEESIEKRMEIIGTPSLSNKENNNENNEIINEEEPPIDDKNDLESNMTKQFINNMVQDRLEKEKQKNMDHTKDKLIKVFKVIKLKNALDKNLKNKKYFMDRLKDIKNQNDKKKLLCIGNAINYNYSPSNEKKEVSTDTDNLDKLYDKVYQKIKNPNLNIEQNNNIEIKSNKKDNTELNKENNEQFTINKKENISNELKNVSPEKINKIEIAENDKFSLNLLNKEKEDNGENKEKSVKREKRKKRVIHKRNESMPVKKTEFNESKESDLNISGISKMTEDKEIQIEPVKELKITTKKILKKEILKKKKFLDVEGNNSESFSIISPESIKEEKLKKINKKKSKKDFCEVGTQTPKLRPPNKAPKKIIFHEIKTIVKKEPKPLKKYEKTRETNLRIICRKKENQLNKDKISEEEEENEEHDRTYRIDRLINILKFYLNNRIVALKLIYWIKWKKLSNIDESNKRNLKLRRIFMNYPRIFAMKLLEFLDEYNDLQGGMIITNNVIRKNIFKTLKKNILKDKNENIYYNLGSQTDKKNLALEKIKSILKKYAGKYVFNLYKKSRSKV